MTSILFACGAPHGGAFDSTISLAASAQAAGHHVRLVCASADPYQQRRRLTAALVKARQRHERLGSILWAAHDQLLSGSRDEQLREFVIRRARDLPAAVARIAESADLLVVNSVRRLDLERIIELAAKRSLLTVWYLREPSSLAFVGQFGSAVHALIANSLPLAEEARMLSGRAVPFVPSVINRSGLTEPTTRDELMLVNPLTEFGVDTAIEMARHMPDQHIVLQESWPLDEKDFSALSAHIADLPNVVLRRRVDRNHLFRSTKAIIAPYSVKGAGSSRPRVMLEAQLLGIPMIAHDVPGLRSVAASAELLVPVTAGVEGWAATVRRLDAGFEQFSKAARRFADDEMPSAAQVWQMFAASCALQG